MKRTPELRLLTSQHANPRNPRKITPAQLEQLLKSLEKYGDLGGIVFNRRTGHLVGGHQRLAAFRLAEVPAHVTERLKKPDSQGTVAWGWVVIDNTRYAYREVDWPESAEAVANLAANKLGGDWDDALLKSIVADLAPNTDLDGTGFSADEIARLMATNNEPRTPAGPRVSDEEYSLFELIMRHENKRRWVAVLDALRTEHNVKTLEDAIMIICDDYE